MFVIRRHDDGQTFSGHYVAVPGSKYSYTVNLRFAQRFKTKESAEENRCGENESVVPLDAVFSAPAI